MSYTSEGIVYSELQNGTIFTSAGHITASEEINIFYILKERTSTEGWKECFWGYMITLTRSTQKKKTNHLLRNRSYQAELRSSDLYYNWFINC